MKKQYIITEAKQIKQYVEQHKKIPSTNTYTDKTIYSIYTTSYLLAEQILNWKKESVDAVDVRIYNQKKYADTINEKVLKEDYLKMIRNFRDYCRQNHRVPTYITTQKSKIKTSFELFTYCLAKIVVFYAEKGTLPNYCLFNKADLQKSATPTKTNNKNPAKPIATKSDCTNPYNSKKGCEAMGQNNSYYCGVCALQKVLYKFGINETQKSLANLAGTTSAGTSHQGLRTAIAYVSKKHKVKLSVKEAYFSDYTLKQIKDIICNPKKDIILHSLYRNKYGHYEKIKSVDTENKVFEIVNSLGDKCSYGCFCGYIEKRTYATQKQYCKGISQKSLIIITKE